MIVLNDLLKEAGEHGASDLHLSAGVQPKMRIDGKLKNMPYEKLAPSDTLEILVGVMTVEQRERFEERGEMDISFSIPKLGRYRMSAYKQRGTVALAVRIMGNDFSIAENLGIPKAFLDLHNRKRGLILVTGPAGSGLSTTVAALIDRMNHMEESVIITLEDPIEYMHHHHKSMVNQREIGLDTKNYATALQSVLREDPDVIYIGTVPDIETTRIALAAAEAGCLVITTMHTIGAYQTLQQMIHGFPVQEQEQIRLQIAGILTAVVSQQLVPVAEGQGRIPAFEVMLADGRVREMIRANRLEELPDLIMESEEGGMRLMDDSLIELYREGKISGGYAVRFAVDKERVLEQTGDDGWIKDMQ